VTVRTLGGVTKQLPVDGITFDPGQTPAWTNNLAYGYITEPTLRTLGETAGFNELRIIAADNRYDQAHVRDLATALGAALEREGRTVGQVSVPTSWEQEGAGNLKSFLYLLEVFSILTVVLSSILIATLLSALLAQQVRQIGVMKAIGASRHQLIGMYVASVMLLAVAALVIAMPLAYLAGQVFAGLAAGLMNINITSTAVPHSVIAVQVGLGLLVPLLAAAWPVYKGSRVTVREALGDYGTSQRSFGTGRFERLLGRIRSLPRPVILALRNTFRRRTRMLLILLMLSIGGATFIAALSSAASWRTTIDHAVSNSHYDIDMRYDQPYATADLETAIRSVPGVAGVESWGHTLATPKTSDGATGSPFALFAPPAGTELINPIVTSGRWLKAEDTNAIVINATLAKSDGQPELRVGDTLKLALSAQDTGWTVVGIVREIGSGPAAYVPYDYFATTTKQIGMATNTRITTTERGVEAQKAVSRALEQKLAEGGFKVFFLQRLTTTHQVIYNHIVIILFMLMVVAILVALVGALGLASTMSLNIMERTREIGIMRAIGAPRRAIMQIVIVEGLVIGCLSWFVSCALAIPLTRVLADKAGGFFLKVPMEIVMPLWIPFVWLVLVVVVAILASYFPAKNAARLTVREVLAYE
jgi:putative ABC transport system permease protein